MSDAHQAESYGRSGRFVSGTNAFDLAVSRLGQATECVGETLYQLRAVARDSSFSRDDRWNACNSLARLSQADRSVALSTLASIGFRRLPLPNRSGVPSAPPLELLWVPSGQSQAVVDQKTPVPNEQGPPTGYWISRMELSVSQYCALTGGSHQDLSKLPSHPVTRLTIQRCIEYCDLLTKWAKDHGHIDASSRVALPTEAQWEYAAKLQHPDRAHPIGHPLPQPGHYPGTTPIGSAPVESNGLYDMAGNVSEWCLDPWIEQPLSGLSDHRPRSAPSGWNPHRVIRGRNSLQGSSRSQIHHRAPQSGASPSPDTGFRIVIATTGDSSF